jgi:aminomethyltransferase
VTPTIGQIAVQGPEAEAALRAVTGFQGELKYFSHQFISLGLRVRGNGVDEPVNEYAEDERNAAMGDFEASHMMISATGYTGERGWELYAKPEILMEIWQRLIDEHGAQPCGLGARDLLRLEAGYCLHGHDIKQDTSPYEAGLDWIVKNPHDYIGKANATRKTKKLLGLAFVQGQKILPREGLEVFDQKGSSIGIITSGNYSAKLERGIALAYLVEPHPSLGTELIVKIRDREHIAKLAEPWFYRNIRKKEIQAII